MKQNIYIDDSGNYIELNKLLNQCCSKGNILVVCGKAYYSNPIGEFIKSFENRTVIEYFRDYSPNPDYSSVIKGVDVLKKSCCNTIIAVGGGSAIDVAKCIKLYAMTELKMVFPTNIVKSDIRLIVIPTTAGSGAESTRFAVVYMNGAKQSIDNDQCYPDDVILDSSLLRSLPLYQRKSTMMDALCHAMESYWSVNASDESRFLAKEAAEEIYKYKDGYFCNTAIGNRGMLFAANKAGRAINISKTTAAHAMSYKLTTKYGIAHGHAVALCMKVLLPYLEGLALYMERFNEIYEEMKLDIPDISSEDIDELTESVNRERLANTPVQLRKEDISEMYLSIANMRPSNES